MFRSVFDHCERLPGSELIPHKFDYYRISVQNVLLLSALHSGIIKNPNIIILERWHMVLQRFIEKDANGELQGLILLWHCAHCETAYPTWLTRKEASIGEKHTICILCRGINLVKFAPSDIMSDREKNCPTGITLHTCDRAQEYFRRPSMD